MFQRPFIHHLLALFRKTLPSIGPRDVRSETSVLSDLDECGYKSRRGPIIADLVLASTMPELASIKFKAWLHTGSLLECFLHIHTKRKAAPDHPKLHHESPPWNTCTGMTAYRKPALLNNLEVVFVALCTMVVAIDAPGISWSSLVLFRSSQPQIVYTRPVCSSDHSSSSSPAVRYLCLMSFHCRPLFQESHIAFVPDSNAISKAKAPAKTVVRKAAFFRKTALKRPEEIRVTSDIVNVSVSTQWRRRTQRG